MAWVTHSSSCGLGRVADWGRPGCRGRPALVALEVRFVPLFLPFARLSGEAEDAKAKRPTQVFAVETSLEEAFPVRMRSMKSGGKGCVLSALS